jgi:hypothetical protein
MITLPRATLRKAAFAECNAQKNTRQSWENKANFGQFPSFAECRESMHSTKKFFLKKKFSLSSALEWGTRQRIFQKKSFFFAECHAEGHSANKFSKKNFFLCRVQDGEHSAKYFSKKIFAECRAEGHSPKKFSKKKICRVSEW